MNKTIVLTCIAFLLCNVLSAQAPQADFLGVLTYGNKDLSDIWGYESCGQEYALVGHEDGLSIVDVTDPTNPTQLHFVNGPNNIWRDIKTWNDHAYVVTEGGGGLLIVDLTGLPGSIQTYNWSSGTLNGNNINLNAAHNIFIDEKGIAYICGGYSSNNNGGVFYLDLNVSLTNPPILGRYTDTYVHDLFVRGDTMWTAEFYAGRIRAIDVTNKANEIVLGQVGTPHNAAHNVWLSDDNRFMFTTDETGGGCIGAFNVADPANMFQVDIYSSSNAIPHNTFVIGDYLVNSYYTDGVTVVDVSNPYNMVEVDDYDTSPSSGSGFAGCWGVYPYLPSGNILATDQYEGLFVLGDPNATPGGGSGSGVSVNLKVMLEGAYAGGNTMNASLTSVLPLQHPYNVFPYNYTGTESLTTIPSNMVDWVLVEARSGNPSTTGIRTTTTEETKAGILLTDGRIVGTDGSSPIEFTSLTNGSDYYYCVRHRNHMDVLTSDPRCASSNAAFDFTSSVAKAFGSNQMKLSTDGSAMMYSGDYDADGDIQNLDFDFWSLTPAVLNTYDFADGNLDGIIQVTDFDQWYYNRSKVSIVEIEF